MTTERDKGMSWGDQALHFALDEGYMGLSSGQTHQTEHLRLLVLLYVNYASTEINLLFIMICHF
jgi:hypothetical protein